MANKYIMNRMAYKISGIALLAIGLFFVNAVIAIGMHGSIKLTVQILFDLAAIIQLYNFLFSSYRGNFLYWLMMAIYFVSGVIGLILARANVNYAMASLFFFYVLSLFPAICVQLRMKKIRRPKISFISTSADRKVVDGRVGEGRGVVLGRDARFMAGNRSAGNETER